MASAEYQIVFRGEVTGELPEHAVKQNLAALFKMPESRIEGLFSGKPVVVKKGVDEATARKFEAAFRKAGAVCELQETGASGSTAGGSAAGQPQGSGGSGPTQPQETSPASASDGEPNGQPGSSPPAAGPSQGSVAAQSIAAAGDPNQTIVSKPVPDELDDLGMSEPGEPLVTEERDKTPPNIDTSELTISDEPFGDGRRTTDEDPGIDTSDLSIVPPE